MSSEKPRFPNVDDLVPQVSLEQAAAFYGVTLPELKQVGDTIRTKCFLNCGRSGETGDRALSINTADPKRTWKCHNYGCPHGGNLVSLCDLMKPGPHMGGKPRGDRFKEIVADIQAMVGGVVSSSSTTSTTVATTLSSPSSKPDATASEAPPSRNIPLKDSDNERARTLVTLDEKFIVDTAEMNPAAANYFRKRPFLTPDVCRKWRMGYLPRDPAGDKSGGTMRGSIVAPVLSETGDVLTWFGRDPGFEDKHRQWEAGGRQDREPEKFHFVKGFHRGLELFGQHASRLQEPSYREQLSELGLIVVEGRTDVIALDCLGVPSVGLMSNIMTREQAAKLTRFAKLLAGNRIVLLLDCDPAGETGAKEALWLLAQTCDVRLGWSSSAFSGQFAGRQPESLTRDEWDMLATNLAR